MIWNVSPIARSCFSAKDSRTIAWSPVRAPGVSSLPSTRNTLKVSSASRSMPMTPISSPNATALSLRTLEATSTPSTAARASPAAAGNVE